MSASWARVNGVWERMSGSGLLLGTAADQAARGDHVHDLYPRHAQHSMTGGGTVKYASDNYFSWTSRFTVNAGRGPTKALAGLFDITMPAAGTPLNVVGGAPARNWTAAGVLIDNWQALYYALPLGGPQASVPGNFYIASYGVDWNIPENWVFIAARSGDPAGHVKVGIGVHLTNIGLGSTWAVDTGWIAPTLLNGWVNYGANWEPAGYRRKDGILYLRGLITAGAASTTFFNLPAGFRPGGDSHQPAMGHASSFGVINVYRDGRVNYNTSTAGLGYFSLQIPPIPIDA